MTTQTLGTQNFLLSTDNTTMATERLPQYIRIVGSKISKANKLRLRKSLNITFKGKSKAEQKFIIMNTAKSIRGGAAFKNIKFAYRFLARNYNQAVGTLRKQILEERERIRILNKRRRKAVRKLKKKLILLKLRRNKSVLISANEVDLIGATTTTALIREVLKNEFALLEIMHRGIDNEERDRYLTLNQMNASKLATFLKDKQDGEEWEYDEYDFDDFERFEFVRITIPEWIDEEKYKNKDGKVKTKNGGGFFRYLNNTKFDLTKFGVFTEVEPTNYDENCLIRALKEGGLDEDKLNYCKGMVVNREIPMCKLKIICNKLKICIRLRKLGSEKKCSIYGKGNEEIYEIGLLDKHYFIIQKVDFTMYALKNYSTLIQLGVDEMKNIYKMRGEKVCRSNERFTDSWKAIKYMLEEKEEYLLPIAIDEKILETQFLDKAFDLEHLEYPDEMVKENGIEYDKEGNLVDMDERREYKAKRAKEWTKWYFDFETFQSRIEDKRIRQKIDDLKASGKLTEENYKPLKKDLYINVHVPFMVCAYSDDGLKIVATGEDCGRTFMKLLIANTKKRESGYEKKGEVPCKKVMLIAHNCGYDYKFLRRYLFGIEEKLKGSGLMNATGKYMNHKTKEIMEVQFNILYNGVHHHETIEIKDSYKLITMPLSKFGKCFSLQQEKEVMPYGLYKRDTLKENWINVKRARRYLKNDEEYKHFRSNVKELGLTMKVDGEILFDMMKYSEYYCLLDCKVLMKGYETFRGWIIKALGIDIDGVWTIASLANQYLEMEGVYDGVFKLSGIPQQFIQKCVVGGRTMCRDNVKHKVEGVKMADYDGVSLYPSSMVRMKGTLLGKPKVLQPSQLNHAFLKSVDGYFIKIRITRVGIKRHFSLISAINDDGVRVFCNDVVGKEFYVDMTTLEDWINFMDIDFEVIRGYYYDEGRNP